MTRRYPSKPEPTPFMSAYQGAPEDIAKRGGIQFRLLQCDRCAAVWPTERSDADGGARLDGEPCAYVWSGGRVCRGHVHPLHGQRPVTEPWWGEPPPHSNPPPVYGGQWCRILEVPWGTRDLSLIRRQYRALSKVRHPDVGGSTEAMRLLNDAYRQALAELDGKPR
jgi:hypothetical protein